MLWAVSLSFLPQGLSGPGLMAAPLAAATASAPSLQAQWDMFRSCLFSPLGGLLLTRGPGWLLCDQEKCLELSEMRTIPYLDFGAGPCLLSIESLVIFVRVKYKTVTF